MMRRWAALSGAAVLAGLLVAGWGWRLWTGPGPLPSREQGALPGEEVGEEAALVRIPLGMTLTAAADSLAARGLLRHPAVLRAGARLTGRDRALRAGLYSMPYGSSPRELLRILTAGEAVQVKVTIPEGLAAEDIAALVAGALGFPPIDFLAAADSLVAAAAARGGLLKGTPAAHDSLLAAESARHPRRFHWCEGHLAPDTFQFAEGTSAAAAALFLVTTQWARLDSVMAVSGSADSLELSRQEVLTLASIVEAEARRSEERPLIAAVYVNRLRKGWRLEADPTVAFVLQKQGKRLFYKDLEVSSAFNTYLNRGLPPGPIGSPGLAALTAAAHPDSTCRAMFFVSDGAGGHVFSRTGQEHEKAVRDFRRARKADRGPGNH